ncbi:L-ascorbate oxidase [Trichoderma harzianum]|uniref:L-ascorbate oxidase n=1 Tax=Trichoderma harzianum TaxID=5544 RepID=A0A0F9XA75_TRIHA|nr:L-ascorbate oxidase [Trichoderma harzianum]
MRCLIPNGVFLFISLFGPARAAGGPRIHDVTFIPDRVLRVTRREIGVGGIRRLTTLINDTLPGPELHIPKHQVVWIRVYNDMTDANLTMHWHGLAQAAAPFSDGAPMGSQWPIPPMHYFDYELKTPLGTAGTYFYHSHIDFQTSTANGPLIVDDSGSLPYPVDGDCVIHLQELFEKRDKDISDGLRAAPFVWSGETGGFLINGNTISNYPVVDPASARLSVIEVDPGKTYRFRYVGATGLSYAALAFENHTNLEIIEADGEYTKSYSTPLLQIGSGQRFSSLFKTKTCAELALFQKLDFYLQIESRDRPRRIASYAVLRYSNTCSALQHRHLHSRQVPTTALPSYRPIDLPPTIEGFLDYDASMVNYGLDPETKTYPAKLGEVIEIVFQQVGALSDDSRFGGGLDTHPWHAHGDHFYDIGGGPGVYDPEVAEQRLEGTHPVRRDTTMLFRYTTNVQPDQPWGWRAWRLRVQNPGVWMMHRHTLQHMIMGMQTVWVFGDADDILKVKHPYVEGYLEYGGSVNGNATHPAVAVHYFETDD